MPLIDWLLNPSGLTAHGFCLSWAPGLIALHVVSDALIGLAYFSIPLAIAVFLRRRPDLKHRHVADLFVAFILACGTTHLWSILTLWFPAYGVEGVIKAATAVLSVMTAATLWPLIPRLLAAPSAADLERLNGELAARIRVQSETAELLTASEAKLQALNAELEDRVAKRTAELVTVNAELQDALAGKIRAQTALAKTEAQFRGSFEAAAVGKTQSDPVTGRIIRANRAFADMLGYAAADLVGRVGWEFTHPDDIAEEQAVFAEVLSGVRPSFVREKRFVRRSGEVVWGRVSATIVRAPDTDEPMLTISVIENIDERHKSREALEAAKHALEVALAERTTALQQRDLLLRETYHRVKNNLQIVDSMVVMQTRDLADPAAREALGNLRQRIYALGLVHQQLMESANLETFDIAPFLEELVRNIIDGGASDEIALSVKASPLKVGLDFGIPLGMLVTELVTNCLKHAFPAGHGAIDVTLQASETGEVLLVVADDGIGYREDAVRAPGLVKSVGTRIINPHSPDDFGTLTAKFGK